MSTNRREAQNLEIYSSRFLRSSVTSYELRTIVRRDGPQSGRNVACAEFTRRFRSFSERIRLTSPLKKDSRLVDARSVPTRLEFGFIFILTFDKDIRRLAIRLKKV